MIQKNKFQLSFKDILKEEQKISLEQIVQLTEKLKSQQTKEEKIKTEQEIKDLIIKPESTEKKVLRISEIVATEIETTALPGYNFQRIQSTESSIEGGLSIIQNNKESIEKQEAIQNVLLNHFKVEQSQLIVLTERIEQKHLNHKYFAYYSIVKETGILLVLNDQYGQAARIKKVESMEDAETQLALLIAMLENSNKKTMDEVQEFEAFANIYTSKEDLEELYIRKINQYTINACDKIDLKRSVKEIWESIKGKTIKTPKKKNREIETIQDFIELPYTVIIRGKIGISSIRDILNAILGLKQDEKIKGQSKYQQERKANKLRVESAREKLKKQVLKGELGEKARDQYETYLEIKKENIEEEIELSGSAEDIWERIKGKTIKTNGIKDKQINTIQDFLGLSFSAIITGKMGSTLIRDILNAMLRLEGDEKITSYNSREKGYANKSKIESAQEKLKEKVLEGGLGEKARDQYEAYLKERKEQKIELSGSAEDIWERIKGKTIKTNGIKDKQINTIQDFLNLYPIVIIHGEIGKTLLREITNAMLGLEGDEKITSYHSGELGYANKSKIESAQEKLKQKVLEGNLGETAKEDYKMYLNIESAEDIWNRINGKTIKHQQRIHKLKTIQDFLNLSRTVIIQGEIGSTPVRDIINAILGLEGDEKITTHTRKNEKGYTNKSKIESAQEKLKQKVLEGGLGEKARDQYEAYLDKKSEKTIGLRGKLKNMWKLTQGQTIMYQNREYRVNTIKNFLELAFTVIVAGKIGSTPVRDIINEMLDLKGTERINSSRQATKGIENKVRLESAIKLLKQKVLAGELGEEAQRDIQRIIETEKIQTEINKEIKKI